MKISVLLIAFLTSVIYCFAQPPVNLNPKDHVGDTVTVTGRIYAGYYLIHVNTKPTFLNVYDSSPKHQLMLRIDSGDRKNFPIAPEKYYLNKKISVRGVINDYKGVPLIKITNSAMITAEDIDTTNQNREVVTGRYMTGREFNFGQPVDTGKAVNPATKTNTSSNIVNKTIAPKTDTVVNTTVNQDNTSLTNSGTDTSSGQKSRADSIQVNKADTIPVTSTNSRQGNIEKAAVDTTTKPTQPVAQSTVQANNQPVVVDSIAVNNQTATQAVTTINKPDTALQSAWLNKVTNQANSPLSTDVRIVQKEIPLRVNPSIDAPVIADLQPGISITIISQSKKWSYITVKRPDGTGGINGFIRNRNFKHLKKEGEK